MLCAPAERFGVRGSGVRVEARRHLESVSSRIQSETSAPRTLARTGASNSLAFRGNTLKISTKGQVTIPVEIREKLGLLPDTEVEFEIVGTAVQMRKGRKTGRAGRRGKSIVERLRGRGSIRMSTDEILALTRGQG